VTLALALTLGWASPALAQAADPTRVLSELPGFDFSRLPAQARKELLSVFTDEFDYCGRPLTLLASLKKGDACKHTRRLAGAAAALAADGAPSTEIINQLARYNQSFLAKRFTFKIDERTCQGPANAKVTLVEFSDFECPYCALARPVLEELVKQKPQVRLCWAPFPLSAHPHSTIAGQAALFARDGGKFWVVHDTMFENQQSLTDASIAQLLHKVGLDEKAFAKQAAASKYVDELDASKEVGKNAGVDSTPSLYFNGRKLGLQVSTENLTLSLDDELDWQAGNNAWPAN
jgi:protein-disulfide isomerase